MRAARAMQEEDAYDLDEAGAYQTPLPPPNNMDEESEEVEATNEELSAVSVMFFIGILALVGVLAYHGQWFSIVLFGLALIPSIIFLLFWRSNASHLLPLESVIYSYALGFFPGAVGVLVLQSFGVIIFSNMLLADEIIDSDSSTVSIFDLPRNWRFYSFLIMFSIFCWALLQEGMKYWIVRKGRESRPDLTDISAYLWYATSGALGFSTFQNLLYSVLEGFTTLEGRVLYAMARCIINTPLQAMTGLLIGIGLAKREVFGWNLSSSRVLILPVTISAAAEFQSLMFRAELDYPVSLVAPLGIDMAVMLLLALYLYREYSSLPASFQLLDQYEEEIEMHLPEGGENHFVIDDEDEDI